jgi:hypothetical protein
MYYPAAQIQVPREAELGSYYFLKNVGASPTVFLSKKGLKNNVLNKHLCFSLSSSIRKPPWSSGKKLESIL